MGQSTRRLHRALPSVRMKPPSMLLEGVHSVWESESESENQISVDVEKKFCFREV